MRHLRTPHHSAVAGTRFVGREAEQERILSLLSSVSAGPSRVVLLSGEPGVGTTRLASQAQTHAARLGIRSFSAAALSSRRRWLSFRSPRPIRLRSPIQRLSHRWRRASAGPSLSTWPRRAPLVLLLDDLHWA